MQYPYSEKVVALAEKSWSESFDREMPNSYLVGYFMSYFNNMAEKMKAACPEEFAKYEKYHLKGE